MEFIFGIFLLIFGIQVFMAIMEMVILIIEATFEMIIITLMAIGYVIVWPFLKLYRYIRNRRRRSTGSFYLDPEEGPVRSSSSRSTPNTYLSIENSHRSTNLSDSKWKTVWRKIHSNDYVSTLQVNRCIKFMWDKFVDLFREEHK